MHSNRKNAASVTATGAAFHSREDRKAMPRILPQHLHKFCQNYLYTMDLQYPLTLRRTPEACGSSLPDPLPQSDSYSGYWPNPSRSGNRIHHNPFWSSVLLDAPAQVHLPVVTSVRFHSAGRCRSPPGWSQPKKCRNLPGSQTG